MSMPIESVVAKIKEASDAYYNTDTPIMSDDEFNALVDIVEKHNIDFADQVIDLSVGAEVTTNKVKLTVPMSSLNKVRADDGTLDTFLHANRSFRHFVRSDKLDGGSVQLTYEAGILVKATTRGDGKIGKDISHMIPFMDNVPKTVPGIAATFVVRAEGVMSHDKFNAINALLSDEDKYSNPRNLANGILNKLTIHEHMASLDIVAYKIVTPIMSPAAGFVMLEKLGFAIPWFDLASHEDMDQMAETLVQRTAESIYDIDGIVVSVDVIEHPTEDNPTFSAAFKGKNEVATTTVLDVVWTLSKHGYWKPRVQIEPVQLSGVEINWATGYNYRFIKLGGIGPGAVIQIVRSGEVIPKIVGVITPVESSVPPGNWELTDTEADAYTIDELTPLVKCKGIYAFLSGLGVEHIALNTIEKMYDQGFTSIDSYLIADRATFNAIDGFVTKGDTIYESVQNAIKNADYAQVASNSGFFGRGFGSRRITAIRKEYLFEDLVKLDTATVNRKVQAIEGFAEITATAFANGLPGFMAWVVQYPFVFIEDAVKVTSDILQGKHVCFTGVRDDVTATAIRAAGGEIDDGVKKTTHILVCKDKTSTSAKIVKARDNGLIVMSHDEMKSLLGL